MLLVIAPVFLFQAGFIEVRIREHIILPQLTIIFLALVVLAESLREICAYITGMLCALCERPLNNSKCTIGDGRKFF
jgi:hypothetical protein